MKQFSILLAIFLLLSSCQAQELEQEKLLVQTTEIQGLLDSIHIPAVVQTVNANKQWTPAFSYIDSISVKQITYLSDGLKVNGFVVQPKKAGSYPCVIWNRGGVKEYGAITLIRAAAMLGKLASKGYVVIGSQYRGNGGSEGQEEFGGAEINDVLNLQQVLAEIPQADTTRIGMFGGSRGGMMTYIALTKTDKIKAAVVLAAPSDKYASIADRPSLENSLFELVEDYEQHKEQELDKRSAIKWVDQFPKNVPILMMHGNSDWRVKSTQSLRLALEFDKHRIPYKLMIFEGGDHGLSEHRTEYYAQLIAWFDKYLKEERPLPDMAFHGR